MSWSISIPKMPRDEFGPAVDKVSHPEQDGQPIKDEDFSYAKDLLKYFANKSALPFLSGSASGHDLRQGQEPGYYNGMSVSVVPFLTGD